MDVLGRNDVFMYPTLVRTSLSLSRSTNIIVYIIDDGIADKNSRIKYRYGAGPLYATRTY